MSQASQHKIAVLIHARDRLESPSYVLNRLIDVWRRSGIGVMILCGVDRFQAAEALILHVDLTVIPQDYVAFSKGYPVVINGGIHDISKRKISANLLRAGDSYEGEVIVKSDLNYGGRREMSHRNLLYRQASARLPWGWNHRLCRNEYPVFRSPAAVPRSVWHDRRLVVEKFLPEREGEYYCLRQWLFFGDRGMNQRVFSRDPIVKANNVIHREHDVPIPDALRSMRSKLKFEYGKIDYVLHNGEVQLLDANWTPTFNPGKTSLRPAIVDDLAQGLDSFLTRDESAAS